MRTNRDKLVKIGLNGKIHHPTTKGYYVGYDGIGRILPSVGGIVYNYQLGDSCMDIVGDHVEAGVSIKNPDSSENNALQLFSCVGNEVKILSGEAKGAIGYINGTHGGIEHAFVHFNKEVLEKLDGSETMLIKGYGQGLELLDYPHIKVMNLDPSLLDKLVIKENNNHIEIKVTHHIPACLMGSGLGSSHMMSGDYDIMTQDKEMNRKYKLDTLRFGDFVAIQDHYAYNGPHFKEGAVTIGVVVHSDSYTSGHGPGICVLFTSQDNSISPIIDEQANLIHYL